MPSPAHSPRLLPSPRMRDNPQVHAPSPTLPPHSPTSPSSGAFATVPRARVPLASTRDHGNAGLSATGYDRGSGTAVSVGGRKGNAAAGPSRAVQTPAEAYASAQRGGRGDVASRPEASSAHAHAQAQAQERGVEEWLRYKSEAERGKKRHSAKDKDKDKDKDKERESNLGTMGSKPLFDWITRKLGGRRATIVDMASRDARVADTVRHTNAATLRPRVSSALPTTIPPASTSAPGAAVGAQHPSTPPRTRIGPTTTYPHRPQLSPAQIFPQVRDRGSTISRSETHSLRSYSLASPSERDRRREANNPYPSLPVPVHRASLMSSDAPSLSFLSRSRSPSLQSMQSMRSLRSARSQRSEGSRRSVGSANISLGARSITSSLRPRVSILERRRRDRRPFRARSRSVPMTLDGSDDEADVNVNVDITDVDAADEEGAEQHVADDDASIRPCPPSHPNSPTPSASIMTRTSRSASELLGARSLAAHAALANALGGVDMGRSSSSASVDASASASASSETDGHEYEYERSRQGSTSTKPTTLRSFDSGPGVAHIAQAPVSPVGPTTPTTTSHGGLHGMAGAPGVASPLRETVSASPVSPNSTAPPTPAFGAHNGNPESSPSSPTAPGPPVLPSTLPIPTLSQAPRHTPHHPIFNPHPSSPPDPNASMLTLASSTFASAHANGTAYGYGNGGGTPSIRTQSAHRPTSVSRLSIISASAQGASVARRGSDGPVAGIQATPQSQPRIDAPAAGVSRVNTSISWAPELSVLGVDSDGEASPPLPSAPQTPGSGSERRRDSITSQRDAPAPVGVPAPSTQTAVQAPLAIPLSSPSHSLSLSHPQQHAHAHAHAHAHTPYAPSLRPTSLAASIRTTGTGGMPGWWRPMYGPYGYTSADEGASMRALRRRGSAGSMDSFESRWSWMGAGAGAGAGQGPGMVGVSGAGTPMGGAVPVPAGARED